MFSLWLSGHGYALALFQQEQIRETTLLPALFRKLGLVKLIASLGYYLLEGLFYFGRY